MPSANKFFPLAALGLFAGFFIAVSLARFYGLMSQGLDLGVFDQLLWSITERGEMLSTLNAPYVERHWLGFHFSPALYLLAPLYFIAPHPETLIVLNVLLLSLVAVPVYMTARHWEATPVTAFLWSAATVVSPFSLSAMVWDFHEVAIAAPAIGFALYAVATKNFRLLLGMSALLLLTKEHYGLSVAGLGLLWSIEHGDRKRGARLAAGALLAMAIILFFIMPAFRDASLPIQSRFLWLADPFGQGGRFYILLAFGAVFYLGLLMLPFWFLPLYALAWLLPGASDLAVNILSSDNMMHSIYSYHSAVLVPVLSVAAMRAAGLLTARNPRLKMIELAALTAINSFALGYANAPAPLPGSANLWETQLASLAHPHRAHIEAIGALVPPDAALSAQDNVGSFFTQRARVYDFPGGIDDADAVILHVRWPLAYSQSLFGAPFNLTGRAYSEAVSGLLHDPRWRITYWQDGWLVLQKNKPAIKVNKKEIEKALATLRADYARAVSIP